MKLKILIFTLLFLLSACSNAATDKVTESTPESTAKIQKEQHPKDDIDTIQLVIDEDELQYLYERPPSSDMPVDAEFYLNEAETPIQLEGVKFRGNSTRLHMKKPFNISFTEGQDFLNGSDRLNLNAMYTDPSMMREQLSFEMFEMLGLPVPETKYFRLYINENYEGLYTGVERIDKNFLKNNNLNPEGTLVRDQMRSLKDNFNTTVNSTFSYNIENAENNKASFLEDVFDYRGDPNWYKLGEFQQWVYSTPAGDSFASELFDRVDRKNFLDFLAVHFIIGDTDAFGDDYWMYLNHSDPNAKWMFFPWDKDLVIGSNNRGEAKGTLNDYFSYENPIIPTWQNLLVHKTLATPELREILNNRILELINNELSLDKVNMHIDKYQSVADGEMSSELSENAFALHEQNFFGDLSLYDDRKVQIKEFFEMRYQFLPLHMEEPLPFTGYTVSAENISENEHYYLQNASGYTIAEIIPESVTGNPSVTLEAVEDQEVDGVKRRYEISVTGGSAEGVIILHYRNDVGWLANGNWVNSERDFTKLYNLGVYKNSIPLESKINPFVNQIKFNDVIEGNFNYAIEYKDDSTN